MRNIISQEARDFAHAIRHDLVELQMARAMLDNFINDFGKVIRADVNTKSAEGTMKDCALWLDDIMVALGRDVIEAGITDLEGRLEDCARGYEHEV